MAAILRHTRNVAITLALIVVGLLNVLAFVVGWLVLIRLLTDAIGQSL